MLVAGLLRRVPRLGPGRPRLLLGALVAPPARAPCPGPNVPKEASDFRGSLDV